MSGYKLAERFLLLFALVLTGALAQDARAADCTNTRRLLWRHQELLGNIRGNGYDVPPYCETRPLMASADALTAEFKRTGTTCGMPANSLEQLAKLRDELLKRRQACEYGVGQGPLVPGSR